MKPEDIFNQNNTDSSSIDSLNLGSLNNISSAPKENTIESLNTNTTINNSNVDTLNQNTFDPVDVEPLTLESLNVAPLDNNTVEPLNEMNVTNSVEPLNVELNNAQNTVESLDFNQASNMQSAVDNLSGVDSLQSVDTISFNAENNASQLNDLNSDIMFNQPVEEPTIPIPENMPLNNYQATVSTPVDYATPMPEFDEIGTSPELDPKAKRKKGMSKTLLFLLIFVLVAGLAYAGYYLVVVKEIFKGYSVKTNNFSVELGEDLPTEISKYGEIKNTSSTNCIIDNKEVDTTKVGKYEFTITCGEDSFKGTISVVDTTAPQVVLNFITASSVNKPDASAFIKASSEENVVYAFADSQALNISSNGVNSILINATDENGNVAKIVAPYYASANTLKNYALLAEKNLSSENQNVTATYKDIILYDYNDSEFGITVVKFVFALEQDYENLVKEFTPESKTLTYQNMTGIPVFNKAENSISLVMDYKGSKLSQSYPATKSAYESDGSYKVTVVNAHSSISY